MDFTENLKLTQFTENDVTSWTGNYNNDMAKIDVAYGNLTTSTSVSSAEIKVLQEKVGTLETTSAQHTDQISVNTSSIAANVLEIQTLEARENAHYDSLTEQIDALAESGESNQDAIKVLQSNVKTVRDIAAVNTSSISKMQLRVDALESGAQDFEEETRQTLEDHTTRIGELESGLVDTDAIARKASVDAAAAVTTASVASAQVLELTTTVDQLDTDLESAETKIASVENATATNAENIVELHSTVANNTTNIASTKVKVDMLDTRVEMLEDAGNNSELTQRVNSLETWKGTASSDITTAQETADTAKTVAENVQSQVSGIKSGASVPFSFGTDAEGNYGYIKAGADTVTPFKIIPRVNHVRIQKIGEANDVKIGIEPIIVGEGNLVTVLICADTTGAGQPVAYNPSNGTNEYMRLVERNHINSEIYDVLENIGLNAGYPKETMCIYVTRQAAYIKVPFYTSDIIDTYKPVLGIIAAYDEVSNIVYM